MIDKDKTLPPSLFPFIWHFLRAYKSAVVVYVALAIAAGFWGPFNSMLIKQIINRLSSVAGGDASILIIPASLIVVNFIVLLHMDRIIVFDQGIIVEDGSHAELLANNGLYRTLWDAQVGGFLPDKKNEDK